MPQTGRLADLSVGEPVALGWDAAARPASSRRERPGARRAAADALPAAGAGRCCGSSLLIVLPHVGIAVLSLREQRRAARLRASASATTSTFFDEPLYWHTLRPHGGDLDPRHGADAGARLSGRLLHRQDRARPRRKSLLFLLCLMPLWVSDLVRALGWMMLLRETGMLSRTPAMRRARRRRRSSSSTTTRRWCSALSTPSCCS